MINQKKEAFPINFDSQPVEILFVLHRAVNIFLYKTKREKMKKIIIVSVIFLLTAIAQLDSQVIEQYAIASRMFYFNSGGLVNQTPELLSPRADSQCSAESYSMKTLAMLDGVYYQALGSAKFEAGFQKTALR